MIRSYDEVVIIEVILRSCERCGRGVSDVCGRYGV